MRYWTICTAAELEQLLALQYRGNGRPTEGVAAGAVVNESGGVTGDRSVEYRRTNYVGVSDRRRFEIWVCAEVK